MSTWLDEIREWLDTETKAILCADPPEKLVSIGIESYSLLMLHKSNDDRRIEESVQAIRKTAPVSPNEYPFVVGRQMSKEDALAGQFALACCDCVTAFVRDEIVDESVVTTFRRLHREILKSPEFESIDVRVDYIPQTDAGRRFCWQFFGLATGMPTPATFHQYRKKARMIAHWGRRIGADITVNDIGDE